MSLCREVEWYTVYIIFIYFLTVLYYLSIKALRLLQEYYLQEYIYIYFFVRMGKRLVQLTLQPVGLT